MACGTCGKGNRAYRTKTYAHDSNLNNDIPTDSRNMHLFADDPENCSQYSGKFRRTIVFVVGLGTEHEKLFLKSHDALRHATKWNLSMARRGVTQLCDERVRQLLGA